MIHRRDDVEFELPVTAGLEDTGIDLDLFHTGAVELFEGCDYAGFLAGSGGTVDEEVRKVSASCLDIRVLG